VDVPGTFTLDGLSVPVRLGAPFNVSPTVPVKPRTLVRLTVDVQEEPPATTAMKKGSVEISKSGCFTCTITTVEEWTELLVPVPVMSTK
jgi:hypothetical protein